jgi:peptide/nickel transport system substrate-binding protein
MVIRSFGMPGQPIPNLAAALPEVTDGGITYTFTIRRGIRFSDGRPLRPSDVAYSLNRSLKGPLGGQLLNTLSRSDADDGAGTVTLHLARPDPEFLYKLATPPAVVLPRGSGNPPADRPLPGTGPYRIAQFSSGRRFRLERNPYFKVWSAAARPDGYPDAISVERVKSVEEGVGAVSSGAADHLAMPLLAQSTKLLPDLRRRFGDRLHTSVPAGVQWVWMNFDFPPFNRLAARQAVQVALDRQAVLRQQGGTAGARLTCRIIPPGLAGHEAEPCPYPERPDLAKARRLVRASGTRGMRVTVLTGAPDFTTLGRLLGRTLDSIGYRATVRTLPIGDFFTLLARPRHDGNIGPFGWFADYPAPSNFFLPLFTCGRPPLNTNPGHFCDRGLDALMRRAQRLQAGQPVEANRLWAEVDRRLVEQAAVLPLTNGVVHDFVSERVGNYQTGAFGVRAEQLWVR